MASPDPDISFNLQDNDSAHHYDIDRSPDNQHALSNCPQTDQHTSDDTRYVHMTQDTASLSYNNNNTHKTPQNGAYSSRRENQGDFVHSAAPTIHSQLMKPDTYDGSSDFEAYMSHFEDCAELSRWDIKTKCLILASCLRGSARACYMSMSVAERRDYILLCRRLAARFSSNKNQNLWLAKFENRRRQRGESIASLADDLRQLAQRAYSDLDVYSQERLALNMLYRQISPDMQCRCIDNGCHTIIQAVNVIERYEAILGTQSTYVRALSEEPVTNPENDIRKVVQRLESRLDRLEKVCPPVPTQPQRHRQTHPRYCFTCNSNDHFWRDCPQNTDRQKSYNGQHSNQLNTYKQKQGFADNVNQRRQHNSPHNYRRSEN